MSENDWQSHAMNNLAYFRELRGLSQRDLADMIGVSQPTIQRAEKEDASAKLGTYKDCAEVLGLSLADIFSDLSAVEREAVEVFRRIPERKRAEVFQLLRIAQDQPPEEAGKI